MMKELNADVKAHFKSAGTAMKNLVKADLKSNFKSSKHRSSPAFFKAVRDYYLAPRGDLGHAMYVRMGVKFMHIFEEGGTISTDKFMVVRLPAAEQMNLPRISKNNRLRAVLEKLNASGKTTFKHGGIFYVRDGKTIKPLYQLRRSVFEKKRLSFFAHARAVQQDFNL